MIDQPQWLAGSVESVLGVNRYGRIWLASDNPKGGPPLILPKIQTVPVPFIGIRDIIKRSWVPKWGQVRFGAGGRLVAFASLAMLATVNALYNFAAHSTGVINRLLNIPIKIFRHDFALTLMGRGWESSDARQASWFGGVGFGLAMAYGGAASQLLLM
jgi:hypothetical protein